MWEKEWGGQCLWTFHTYTNGATWRKHQYKEIAITHAVRKKQKQTSARRTPDTEYHRAKKQATPRKKQNTITRTTTQGHKRQANRRMHNMKPSGVDRRQRKTHELS